MQETHDVATFGVTLGPIRVAASSRLARLLKMLSSPQQDTRHISSFPPFPSLQHPISSSSCLSRQPLLLQAPAAGVASPGQHSRLTPPTTSPQSPCLATIVLVCCRQQNAQFRPLLTRIPEISGNNRAVCSATHCKKDGVKITKGEIRQGVTVMFQEHPSLKWRHW